MDASAGIAESQPQHVVDGHRGKVREACVEFFEHANANTRYRDQLEAKYEAIDGLDMSDLGRRRARKIARDTLHDDETLEPKPKSMAIILPPGIGKSTMARRAFAEVRPGSADMYFPTSALCFQFEEEFNKDSDCDGAQAIVERPRGGEDPFYNLIDKSQFTDEDHASEEEARKKQFIGFNCPKVRRSEMLANAHASVRSMLCTGCKLRPSCGYWRQEQPLKDAREIGALMIRPHVRLWSGSLVDKSNIKIIDESLIESCLDHISFKLSEMTRETIIGIVGFHTELHEYIDAVYLILDVVREFQIDPNKHVNDIIFDAKPIKRAVRFFKKRANDIEKAINAHHGTADQLSEALTASGLKFINELCILARQVMAAWECKCPMDTMKIDNGNVVVMHLALPDIKETDNVLVLDASFRSNFAQIIFKERDFEVVEVDDVDLNVDVEWINLSASISSLDSLGDVEESEKASAVHRRQMIRGHISSTMGDNILLVSNKKILKNFQADGLSAGWHMANFGGLRGKNEWKDVDGVAIVGQAVPDVAIIERQCAAYSLAAGRVGGVYTVARYYAANTEPNKKSLLPIDDDGNYFHPCPFVWEFIKAKVHDEYVQAVGRCRSVNSRERKRVLIVSKFIPPVMREYIVKSSNAGIARDLSEWHQCLIAEMLINNYALMSPTYLAKKYSLKVNTLKKGKGRSNERMDAEQVNIARSEFIEGSLHLSVCNGLENMVLRNALRENHLLYDGECSEIIGSYSEMFGPHSYSNNSYRKGPLKICFCDVVWGTKQKPSVLMHCGDLHEDDEDGGATDVDQLNLPNLKLVEKADEQSRDMTILRCLDQDTIATKTFEEHRPGKFREVREYQAGAVFEMLGTKLENVEDMAAKLTDLQSYQNCFVIRGKHIEGMTKASVRRTVRSRRESKPFFEDAPKSWIMLDIDEYRPPLGLEWGSEEDAHKVMAWQMQQSLPEPFKSAKCFIQMSASCGLKTREIFKAHAWFFLDKALTSAQARQWIKSIGERDGKSNVYQVGGCKVDTSVLAPVQPHFTSDPLINGNDPFKVRSFVVTGKNETIACNLPEVKMAQRQEKHALSNADEDPNTLWFKFRYALADIGEGLRGFNEGVKNATRYAALIISNRISRHEDVTAIISNAVRQSDPGDRSPEEIDRYASADFINDKIEWWSEVID